MQIVRLELKGNSQVNFSDDAVAEAILNQVSLCTFCYVEGEAVVLSVMSFVYASTAPKQVLRGQASVEGAARWDNFQEKGKR